MYSDWVGATAGGAVFITLAIALLIWNVGLTYFAIKERSFLTKLFPKNGERDIRKKFEELVAEVKGYEGRLVKLSDKFNYLDNDSHKHVQKVKLIRYNPFNDVGGDQSFSIALLDNKGEGVVLTSLHNRSGTRVFAKPVIPSNINQYELSKEEELVIKEALKV